MLQLKVEIQKKKKKTIFKTKYVFVLLIFKSNHVMYLQINGKIVVGQEFQELFVKVEDAGLTILFLTQIGAFIS